MCSSATEETVQCMSFEISGAVSFEGSGEKGGLSPENLRSAYNLPGSGGKAPEQQTVAIVDAYNDPNAESDLKTYREKYKLSGCTESNKCFKKVNQKGEAASYPISSPSWSVEMSLDLDMVSAVCPECHILLVEATSNSYSNMETAENEAATLKATEISDSWGGPERSGETSEDSSFEHSGIPITVAAGDDCYIDECEGLERPDWPATSPHVIAVGGTELTKASNSRGWSESVWNEPESEYGAIGTGSGCSLYESKPSWEKGSSCSTRTDDDVAAVAACKSPLSIYDSYEREGWFFECGTSAASPIIAGVEALSTSEARKDGPELFGKLAGKGKLFDVTEGHDWDLTNCGTYLCNAEVGYDGPTGNGTPDGAFLAGEISEFALPAKSSPTGIIAGPEKKYLWFTDLGTAKIGKMTTSGAITEYSLPKSSQPYVITVGPDGNLWFTDFGTSKVGKITTSGAITEYSLPEHSAPVGIVAGPEKEDLWFAESNLSKIGKITTSGAITEYSLPKGSQPSGITAGPDGDLWFTDHQSSKIGKITTSGTITEYSLPSGSGPDRITAGPDGNLWFTDSITNKVGKITTSGTITEYSVSIGYELEGITAGPDGNLWFTVRNQGNIGEIGEITTSGTVTEYALSKENDPFEIATGPDNNLWFTTIGTSKIEKITP